MKTKLQFILCCVVYTSLFSDIFAQAQDSSHTKLRRPNNIKLNLSSNILYSPAFILSYERTLTPNKTFSVEAGYVEFPLSLSLDLLPGNISAIGEPNKAGFKVDADFRFYLKKENKYEAPHGVYIGPYMAYYHFNTDRTLSFNDTAIATGNVDFKTSLDAYQIGGEIGYQFVIKDRLTIDLVMAGPALSYYHASLSFTGNVDVNEENKYLEDLLNNMIDNFPLLGELVENQQIDADGRADLFFAGFRYSASVGFRF